MLIGLTKPMSASPLPAANNIELSLRKKKPYPQPLHITTVSYPHPLTINLARPNRSISPPVTGNTTKPSINYSSTNVTFTECWGALSLSLSLYIYIYIYIYIYRGDRGGTVVKVLCYKSEGRWFDPSWCHWNFSLT